MNNQTLVALLFIAFWLSGAIVAACIFVEMFGKQSNVVMRGIGQMNKGVLVLRVLEVIFFFLVVIRIMPDASSSFGISARMLLLSTHVKTGLQPPWVDTTIMGYIFSLAAAGLMLRRRGLSFYLRGAPLIGLCLTVAGMLSFLYNASCMVSRSAASWHFNAGFIVLAIDLFVTFKDARSAPANNSVAEGSGAGG